MTQSESHEFLPKRHTRATVCYLVKDQQVLLCTKKKSSFGQGFLMGPGGKIEESESPKECAIRETVEEIGVRPTSLKWAGSIFFRYFNEGIPETQEVYFYLVDQWEGKIQETEEMKPEWFDVDKIPYERMLPANDIFVEPILRGLHVSGELGFNEEMKLSRRDVYFSR